MSNLLWGKVYYLECFAGILREDPGGRFVFTYDKSYLDSSCPAIAYNLPLQSADHINEDGLHPFFDNLIAEGWLEKAQTRVIGKREATRFELLLAFGCDLAGAVAVIDPEPKKLTEKFLDHNDSKSIALLNSRASLSGVQPKLAAIEKNGKLYPSKIGEVSTHIIKFPSESHNDLVINEYLTSLAFKALLPKDDIVEMEIREVDGFEGDVLAIRRFDRYLSDFNQGYGGGLGSGDDIVTHVTKRHFEEFSQLLNVKSSLKYHGSYSDMSNFMMNNKNCVKAEIYRLYLRIIAGILLGNTDMHLKNFAMFNNEGQLRLTPSYDQVSACLYGYNHLALQVNKSKDLDIRKFKAANIISLGKEFDLSKDAINMAVNQLARNIEVAKNSVLSARLGSEEFKKRIINILEVKWKETFSLIGKKLSSKQ